MQVTVFSMRKLDVKVLFQVRRVDVRMAADAGSGPGELGNRLEVGRPERLAACGQLVQRPGIPQSAEPLGERLVPENHQGPRHDDGQSADGRQ